MGVHQQKKGSTMSSKATKLTDKPKLHKRVLDFTNYKALPAIAKAIILAGFGWAVVDNLARFNQLPETAQGATAVVLIALVLKVATNKK